MDSQDSSSIQINKSAVGVACASNGTVKVAGNIYVNSQSQKIYENYKKNHLPSSIDTFKGRVEELKEIKTLFFKKHLKKVVIYGSPGFGKTALASQFARKCKEVNYVFWINAETREDIIQSFKNISYIYDFRKTDDELFIRNIFDKFKETRCLFIYDNVLCKKTFEEYEPPDNFHLLITSQENHWKRDIKSIPLGALCPTDAVEVITAVLKQNDNSEGLYNKLADIEGNIPLALQISAAYVRESFKSEEEHFSLRRYIKRIRESQTKYENIEIPRRSNSDNEKSIYGTVGITLKRIKENTNLRKIALNVLYISAYLHLESIKINDLLCILDKLSKKRNNKDFLMKALTLLEKYAIISYSYERTRIKIHNFLLEMLLFHLNEYDPQIKNKCYRACLEITISDSYRPNINDDVYDTESSSSDSESSDSDTYSSEDSLSSIEETDEDNTYELNIRSIFSHADTNLPVFWEFYEKYRKKLLSVSLKNNWKLKTVLTNLVACGCTKSLERILEDIGYLAKKCVTVFNLQYYVSDRNEKKTLKILRKYDSNVKTEGSQRSTDTKTPDKFPMFRFINSNGESFLHVNAAKFDKTLVYYLITEVKLNANEIDAKGRTPLHSLIYQLMETNKNNINRQDVGYIAMLLSTNGAKLDIKDGNGMTAKELIRKEKLDYLEIFFYLNDKYEKDLSTLLEEMGDQDRTSTYINDLHLIYYAAQHNQVNILKLLLKYNVDINIQNDCQNTALHIASLQGFFEIIRILTQCKHKADINVINNMGNTPLFHYIFGASFRQPEPCTVDEISEILSLLSQGDIKQYTREFTGETLLHIGIISYNIPLINTLITKYNFDVNKQDLFGRTVLHTFLYNLKKEDIQNKEEVSEIARMFKKNGALLDIEDITGKTPLKLAKLNKLDYILSLL